MADVDISDLTPIAAGTVDRASDFLELHDTTADGSYKVTPNALMNISGDAVGTTDTQTLTNKTITAPTISDPVLSGTITGTYTIGGTPTFPSTVVSTTGTQTLTNKTLTSPTINTATIANPTLTVDTVSEFTSTNGVTVDGLNIKDSKLNTNNSVVTANITDASVTPAKWTNTYKFRVRRTSAASTGNGAFAKIAFDAEDFDSNSNFASGTYTAPVSGFYFFSASFAAVSTATGQRAIVSFYKNGSEVKRGSVIWSSAASQGLGVTATTMLQLTASDTVDVYAFGTVTMTIDVSSTELQPEFSGYLVSET